MREEATKGRHTDADYTNIQFYIGPRTAGQCIVRRIRGARVPRQGLYADAGDGNNTSLVSGASTLNWSASCQNLHKADAKDCREQQPLLEGQVELP